jgi:methionine-rich copper-binding protein CopC
LLAGPASAGAHISVEDREAAGRSLKIVARDCVSGTDFEAFVEVELVDNQGKRIEKDRHRADPSGITTVRVRIPADTPRGRYVAIVTCKHVFDAGGSGIFYVSEEVFHVVLG